MYYSKLTRKCYEIAKTYHYGQVDKGGHQYIEHPITVASHMDTEEETCVALLHDTLEDTELTAEDLLKMNIPASIVYNVALLSRLKSEPYHSYILRLSESRVARKVKMADLKHNMDLTRLGSITQKDLDRVAKYEKAYNFLEQVDKQEQRQERHLEER